LEKKMSTIQTQDMRETVTAMVAVGPPANVVALEERVIALEAREQQLLAQRAGLEDRLEAAQQRAELRFFRQRATDAHVERVEQRLGQVDIQLAQTSEAVVSLATLADQLLTLALEADEGEAEVLRSMLAAVLDSVVLTDEQWRRLEAHNVEVERDVD
jgi:hypothetical protein